MSKTLGSAKNSCGLGGRELSGGWGVNQFVWVGLCKSTAWWGRSGLLQARWQKTSEAQLGLEINSDKNWPQEPPIQGPFLLHQHGKL